MLAVILEHLSDATNAVAIPVYFVAIPLLVAWVAPVAVRLRRLAADGGAVGAGFATNESLRVRDEGRGPASSAPAFPWELR